MAAPERRAADRTFRTGHARHRLRVTAILFFIVLAVPLYVLVTFTLGKLAQQARLQERFAAEQTADAVQKRISALIDEEEARPFNQYSFYTAATVEFASQQAVQRSPLSELQPQGAPAGLIGYFQIAPDGSLTSPILPEGWTPDLPSGAFPVGEASQRLSTVATIQRILSSAMQPTIQAKRSAPVTPQVVKQDDVGTQKGTLDSINSSKISQESLLNFRQQEFSMKSGSLPPGFGFRDKDTAIETKQRIARKEGANSVTFSSETGRMPSNNASASNVSQVANQTASRVASAPRITSFEAEIDPLQALNLDGGYIVFFRKAWHGEKRIIQGAVVDARVFLESVTKSELTESSLPPASRLEVAQAGAPILNLALPAETGRFSSYSTRKSFLKSSSLDETKLGSGTGGVRIFETSLPEPLAAYRIAFFVQPELFPAEGYLVGALAAILAIVLVIGTFLLYRLGSAQITLAQKRNDFVSAVSHELKTPLTSIRMYGEMLKNDWVPDEAKKRSYYEYIFQESERLSRLIGNVLRLSKLSNGNDGSELQEYQPKDLLPALTSKVEQITRAAGFTLNAQLDPALEQGELRIKADEDGLSQIAINLVDNAVKFSRDCARKEIEIGFKVQESTGKIIFFVRDFGPGVNRAEQRKIFGLFYRSENELTRKTSGTGIGLALVKGLATGMRAGINYLGREPGAEFQLTFDRLS